MPPGYVLNLDLNCDRPRPPRRRVDVFTDGACSNNGGRRKGYPVLGGIGIHFPNGEVADISQPYPASRGTRTKVTNQRTELAAIHTALQAIEQSDPKSTRTCEIHVYSDSKYSIECVTNYAYTWDANGWKTKHGRPVKNQDILRPLIALVRRHRVRFHHVRAHSNHDDPLSRGNERADQLARAALSIHN